MDSDHLVYGSIGAGILAGVLLLVLLGWVPFYGWILAGVAAGLASRGAGRGFLAGLIAGVVVSMVLIAMALFVPVSLVNTIETYVDNQYLNGTLFAAVYKVMGLQTYDLIRRVAVDGILIPAVGGLIGGAIMSNGYYVQEAADEAPASSKHTARIIDSEKEEEVSS